MKIKVLKEKDEIVEVNLENFAHSIRREISDHTGMTLKESLPLFQSIQKVFNIYFKLP